MISMEMIMMTIINILMMTMVVNVNIKVAIQFTLFNLSQEWKGSINDIRMYYYSQQIFMVQVIG